VGGDAAHRRRLLREARVLQARSVGSCGSRSPKPRALLRWRFVTPKAVPLGDAARDHQPIRQRTASTPSAAKNSHKQVAKIARRTTAERGVRGCAELGRLTIVE
jgi:hypothetical protein